MLSCFRRTWLLLLAAILYSAAVTAQSPLINPPGVMPLPLKQTPDVQARVQQDYQKRFELGISMMDKDIEQSVEIFQALYNDTKAVRVQLELARSLFIARR